MKDYIKLTKRNVIPNLFISALVQTIYHRINVILELLAILLPESVKYIPSYVAISAIVPGADIFKDKVTEVNKLLLLEFH